MFSVQRNDDDGGQFWLAVWYAGGMHFSAGSRSGPYEALAEVVGFMRQVYATFGSRKGLTAPKSPL